MQLQDGPACVSFEGQAVVPAYDREPFGFTHTLSGLDVFTPEALARLTSLYTERDYFVASGAPTAATNFYGVPHSDRTPREAFDRLEAGNQRILLKRPETYDAGFRDLLQALSAQLLAPSARSGRLVRLDSSILISSATTITPFHFDPEISFFFQIAGDKTYHIYSPASLDESELEAFYVKGITNIAQVPLAGKNAAHEYVFALGPGLGMHQPRNAPHWVQTSGSISVSYTISYETDVTRALGQTRAFNFYQRSLGLRPGQPGRRVRLDRLKAAAMDGLIPARKAVTAALRRARGAG